MSLTASPARGPRLVLLALLLVPCAGCLDFEKETVVVAFPKDQDEVRFLLVYGGFRVGGTSPEELTKAKEELTQLTTTDKFFYLSIFVPLHLTEQKDEKADQKRFRELLDRHLKVGKCALFTNKDGKLCGYQTITIKNAKKFTADLNAFLCEQLAKWAQDLLDNEKKRGKEWDKETLDLVFEAARNKHQWVRIEPGRVSFTMPGSRAVFTKARRDILGLQQLEDLNKLLAPGKKEPKLDDIRRKLKDMEASQKWFSGLPLSIDQRKDRVTLSLGFGDGEPFTVTDPPLREPKKELDQFDKDLAAHAKTLKAEFRKDVTTDSLIAEFLKDVKKAK
jgi:hypothetical protein